MAKKGFVLNDLTSLRGPIRDSGWVLCVGAGTSGGLFPDWPSLVESMMIDDAVVSDRNSLLTSLRTAKGFSLDALIQAAQDRLGLPDDEFADRLAKHLYSQLPADPIRSRMLKCLASVAPGEHTQREWKQFIDDVSGVKRIPSAVTLAEQIAIIRGTEMAPKAILTFNAEPLLYALINAQCAVRSTKSVPSPRANVAEPQIMDPITRSISARRTDRIPYYFCHGLLSVRGGGVGLLEDGSPEKLVFSESEYLSLANASFSWQASTFISLALSHSMVFIGTSFTDSNIRKWLSWMYENRRHEIHQRAEIAARRVGSSMTKLGAGSSTLHYWLNVRPKVPGEQEWTESLVAHLGVRLVWLDDWSEVGPAMSRLTGAK